MQDRRGISRIGYNLPGDGGTRGPSMARSVLDIASLISTAMSNGLSGGLRSD
eukprot:CAMPEP_0172567264 /NCGR_PEP_ID=MMETSP1067-20121228/115255_1 /TAXON_ID=265564 ORGANISM="Thalassiosira punctigera, Strain Tpunct2005C2" /NCGR_SAMPLE_ID=MMETSP1067 /ASSEMBLY_ACC=CAM_ASM_000444 /LENGTH=51 /DNA_ID=CAMNT_0013358573 /DNA_START=97 /DNA_END=249 /DNA_ORIENTATION=-